MYAIRSYYADIEVGPFDRLHQHGDGDIVGLQLVGIHRHLVLLDKAADAGHLGDAFHRSQLVAQVPVLQRAQLLQGMVLALQGGGLQLVILDLLSNA